MSSPIPGGFLVAIEGIDGAGKTTQVQLLSEYCESCGLDYVVAKEPTNGQYGARLRQSAITGRLGLEAELDLFLKDRIEHVESLIRPALQAGKVVILDRYYFSTAAYQGALGADPNSILESNERFAPEPDLLILLDLPFSEGLSRILSRGDKPNTFEREEMLTKSREIFLSINRPYRVVIDAHSNLENVSRLTLLNFQQAAVHKISKSDCSASGVNRVLQLFGGAVVGNAA